MKNKDYILNFIKNADEADGLDVAVPNIKRKKEQAALPTENQSKPATSVTPSQTVKQNNNVSQNYTQQNNVRQAVTEMQKSMIDFADILVYDQDQQAPLRRPTNVTDGFTVDDGDHVDSTPHTSRKRFSDFMIGTYLSQLPENRKGNEYSRDPKINTHQKLTATQSGNYEQNVMLDTIKRMGNAGAEIKVNGILNYQTLNGMKNLTSYIYALLQLQDDLGLKPVPDITLKGWQWMSDTLKLFKVDDKGNVTPPKGDLAKAINEFTRCFNAARNVYKYFRMQVLRNPKDAAKIEGVQTFQSYLTDVEKQEVDKINPSTNSFIFLNKPITFNDRNYLQTNPNSPLAKIKITDSFPVSALLSKKNYVDYMKATFNISERDALLFFPSLRDGINRL